MELGLRLGPSTLRVLRRLLDRAWTPKTATVRPPVQVTRRYHTMLIRRRGQRPLKVKRLVPPERPTLPEARDAAFEQLRWDDAEFE